MSFKNYQVSEEDAQTIEALCDIARAALPVIGLTACAVILLWQPLAYLLAWIQTH